MRHTAYKVSTTRNDYGDYVHGAETALPCHFRYITQHVPGGSNETVNSDALVWFEPDSGVVEADVLRVDGVYFRVERVIKARRLRDPTVQFIKCELLRYGEIS